MRILTVIFLATTLSCFAVGPNAQADDGREVTSPFSFRVYGGYGLPSENYPLFGVSSDGRRLLMFDNGIGSGFQAAIEMGRQVHPRVTLVAGVRYFWADEAALSNEAIRSSLADTVVFYTWDREIELDLIVPYVGVEYRVASKPAEVHLSAGVGLAIGSAEVTTTHSNDESLSYTSAYCYEAEGAEFHLGGGAAWTLVGPVGIGLDVQYYFNTIDDLRDEGVRPAVLLPIDVPWTLDQKLDRVAIHAGIRIRF